MPGFSHCDGNEAKCWRYFGRLSPSGTETAGKSLAKP